MKKFSYQTKDFGGKNYDVSERSYIERLPGRKF